jgi:hypothetical protein
VVQPVRVLLARSIGPSNHQRWSPPLVIHNSLGPRSIREFHLQWSVEVLLPASSVYRRVPVALMFSHINPHTCPSRSGVPPCTRPVCSILSSTTTPPPPLKHAVGGDNLLSSTRSVFAAGKREVRLHDPRGCCTVATRRGITTCPGILALLTFTHPLPRGVPPHFSPPPPLLS